MFVAPFVSSSAAVVEYMLKLADLKADEVFFDLGSGDGGAVIVAAELFGAWGVGVELRGDLAEKALCSVRERGLDDRVTIMNVDMFNVDLASADVVYLYLTTCANEKIKRKLERDLQVGARVVSHDYEVIGWCPVKVMNFCENMRLGYPSHTIYLYRYPFRCFWV